MLRTLGEQSRFMLATTTRHRYYVVLMATKYSSSSIGYKQSVGTMHAGRFSNDNGRPLNLMVTIDLTSLGYTDDMAGDAFRGIWKSFSRWWSYERSQGRLAGAFASYVVHEHPPGGPRHVHWAMHAPAEARAKIEAAIRKRVEKASGYACLGRAIHFQDRRKPRSAALYDLKGTHPAVARRFLHIRPSDQGPIIGRRLAVSRAIGKAARERAGWSNKTSL